MKRRIFLGLSFLMFFLRLPIYESIAANFWQSASDVIFLICIGFAQLNKINAEVFQFLVFRKRCFSGIFQCSFEG